jgi:hypothetical protein
MVTGLAMAKDAGLRVPVPYRPVQVPQVLRYVLSPTLLAWTYGAHLGAGFLTRYTYSTHTAVMLSLPLFVEMPLLVFGSLLAFAVGKSVALLASLGTDDTGIAQASGFSLIRLVSIATSASILATAISRGGAL